MRAVVCLGLLSRTRAVHIRWGYPSVEVKRVHVSIVFPGEMFIVADDWVGEKTQRLLWGRFLREKKIC